MTSQGIDYGRGLTNIDNTTGIRFGVISPNSVNPDALQDIYNNGESLTYLAAVADSKQRIADALAPVLEDMGVLPYVSKYAPRADDTARHASALADIAESVWNDIEQDWNDQYQGEDETYRYESDGYVLETSSLGIYVTKSPYYTFAAFCSPCCPGAGDLDSPRLTAESGVKTYCLGPDWFDTDECTMPYTAFNVSDDTEATA